MLHDLWQTVVGAMTSWHQGKLFIEHSLTICTVDFLLHMLVGVLLWIAAGVMLRRPLTSRTPWLWLLQSSVERDRRSVGRALARSRAAIWGRGQGPVADDGNSDDHDVRGTLASDLFRQRCAQAAALARAADTQSICLPQYFRHLVAGAGKQEELAQVNWQRSETNCWLPWRAGEYAVPPCKAGASSCRV